MNVTLAQLGAIGDFVGAIAVLITLFHLANQIKQNTRAVKATTQLAISAATTEVWRNNCIDFERTKTFFELAKKFFTSVPDEPPALTLGHLMGPRFMSMRDNLALAVSDEVVSPVMMIFRSG